MNSLDSDWIPDQLALIRDRSRKWREEVFKSHDAVGWKSRESFIIRKLAPDEKQPEGSSIIQGGWDHEHCALCWETISDHEGFQHSGYTDDNNWLCKNCYQKYILDDFLQLRHKPS